MGNELAKNQYCILMRNGVEIWIDEDQKSKVQQILSLPKEQQPRFLNVTGLVRNVADMTGLFTTFELEDATRRKKGQWQCKYGVWHDKYEKCESCRVDSIINQPL